MGSPCIHTDSTCCVFADTTDEAVDAGNMRLQSVIKRFVENLRVQLVATVKTTWAKVVDPSTFIQLSDRQVYDMDESRSSGHGVDAGKAQRRQIAGSVWHRIAHLLFQLQDQYPDTMKVLVVLFIVYMLAVAVGLSFLFNSRW